MGVDGRGFEGEPRMRPLPMERGQSTSGLSAIDTVLVNGLRLGDLQESGVQGP